jgi:hypothetical protein
VGDRDGGGGGDGGGDGDDSNGDNESSKMVRMVETVWIIGWMVREWCLMMLLFKWKCLWNVSNMRGKLSLWISLFTRAIYRVFILWCEYPMGLFPFCAYKGNEKMSIRKVIT